MWEAPWKTLRESRVVKGALMYFVVGVLTSGTNLLLLPFLTRWLAPDEYGILGIAMGVIQLLQPLISLGMGAAIVRYFFIYNGKKNDFRVLFSSAFWFQCGLIVLLMAFVGGIMAAGYEGCVFGIETRILPAVLLAIAFAPPRELANQVFTARQEHGRASGNQILNFAVATIATVVLVSGKGMGAEGRLYGMACGALVTVLTMYFSPEIRNSLEFQIRWSELRKVLQYGVPYVPHAAFVATIGTIDKLALSTFSGLNAVGVYNAAMTTGMGISFVGIAISRAWSPRFYQLRDADRHFAALKGNWVVLCVLPLMPMALCIVGPFVYPYVVSKRYESGMELLPFVAFASYAFGLFGAQASYLNYWRKTGWLPVISGGGALMGGVFVWILVPRFGMMGAAAAVALGYVIMNVLLMIIIITLEREWTYPVWLYIMSMLFATVGIAAIGAVKNDGEWFIGVGMLIATWIVAMIIWWMGNEWLRRSFRRRVIG